MILPRVFLAFAGAAALFVAEAPATAFAQAVKVRIAWVPSIGASPVFVMANSPAAKEAGLELSLVRFESGPPAISAVASGTIDALAIGIAPVAVARAKGLDVRIVSAAATGGSGFVASPRLSEAFDAAKGNVALAMAEFRKRNGRAAKLATVPPGGVPNVLLNHWLFKLNQVAREDVQILTLGIDAIQQAMLSGSVDGGTVLEPSLSVIQSRDPGLKSIATANEMFDGVPGVVIAVTGAFAKARPEAVDALVAGVVRANALIASRPEEAAALVQPAFGGGLVDRAILARALSSKMVTFIADPRLIEEPTRRMLAYQAEIGDFDKAPSMDGLFDTSVFARVGGK